MPMMKSAPMFGKVAGKAAKPAKSGMAKPAASKPAKALPMRGSRTATNKMKKGM